MLLVKQSREVELELAKKVFELVNAEMQQGNLAHKQITEIIEEMKSNKALIAFWGNELIGYVCYRNWGEVIEIMTIYVKQNHRHKGIGAYLAKCMNYKARQENPGKKIVALVNDNSSGIMQKLGFVRFSNEMMPSILREACAGCYQEKQFPDCHCQYVESINLSSIEFSQLPDITNSMWNTQFYQVYQRLWRDAPWFEDWTISAVIDEMNTYAHKQWPQFILAHSENRLLGFSSGYFLTRQQLAEKAGHDKLNYLFTDNSMVFYLAEVGVVNGLRQNGLGRDLLSQLITYALNQGASKLVARTKAFEAIQLVQKLGFRPTGIYDTGDPQRQYFVK